MLMDEKNQQEGETGDTGEDFTDGEKSLKKFEEWLVAVTASSVSQPKTEKIQR